MCLDSTNMVRSLCIDYFPQIEKIINHQSDFTKSTWDAGLETGKAIEFLALCAVSSTFIKHNFITEIPEIFFQNPDLFYLRNVLPRHYDSQAGHDKSIENKISIETRFLISTLPKVIFKKENTEDFLLFREGHPIHQIISFSKTGQIYLDRPDLIICQGNIKSQIINNNQIHTTYLSKTQRVDAKLRAINHPKVPLISINNEQNMHIPFNGIIECSYSKNVKHAVNQLNQYISLFSLNSECESLLINGKNKLTNIYNHEIILDFSSIESLKQSIDEKICIFIQKIINH